MREISKHKKSQHLLEDEDEKTFGENSSDEDKTVNAFKLPGSSMKKDIPAINFKQDNGVPMEKYLALVKECADFKNRELRHIDTIKQLKSQLDQERKQMRQMRAEKVNFLTQKNELEEFFLQCIEEVRKDIVKRRSISSAYGNKSLKRSSSQSTVKRHQQS